MDTTSYLKSTRYFAEIKEWFENRLIFITGLLIFFLFSKLCHYIIHVKIACSKICNFFSLKHIFIFLLSLYSWSGGKLGHLDDPTPVSDSFIPLNVMKPKWWNLCVIFVSCNSYISASTSVVAEKTPVRTELQSLLLGGEVISVWCEWICSHWCEKTSHESILKNWLVKSRWHNELIASVLQHEKLGA